MDLRWLWNTLLLPALAGIGAPVGALAAEPADARIWTAALGADLRTEHASADVRDIAAWALDSGDSQDLPFVIVDKRESRVFVFDARGRLLGASPALIGSARGDDSVPGIGERPIGSIRPEERTTPAGRFNARTGTGPKGEDILWVDYDQGLALHRVVTNVPQERRLERLRSKSPADRRITYGCINVPAGFFDDVVRPAFSSTQGVVYILPESRAARALFDSYEVRHADARTHTSRAAD